MSSDINNRNCPYCSKKDFPSRDSKYKHIQKYHSEQHTTSKKEMPQTKKRKTETAVVPYAEEPELEDLFTLEVMALRKRIDDKKESTKQILSEGKFFSYMYFFLKLPLYYYIIIYILFIIAQCSYHFQL